MGMLTFIESERAERARKEMEEKINKDKPEINTDMETGVASKDQPGSVEDESEKKKSTKKAKSK